MYMKPLFFLTFRLFLRLFVLLCVLFSTGKDTLHAQLVNTNSTRETYRLKAFLDSLYGKKLISGQMDDSYLAYIEQTTGGKRPAMMGYDFNGICPSQGGNNDAAKAIRWVKEQKGIAQFQWHWISPNADGDWSTNRFNLAAALADTASASYKNMIRDMDLAAAELKKMQTAGVPILWRPLHEAEGKWFWWGMSGGAACKALWRLMYTRYTNHHGLNNLIWVWNSYGTTRENWYPGDDVVDIIAWDYPDYSASNGSWKQYQTLFGGRGKLFGIGEDGKLTDPDLFASQPWSYFLTWAYMVQDPTKKDGKNTKEWLFKVYNDPRVFTLDDMTPGPKAFAGSSRTVFDTNGDGEEQVTLDGSASKTDEGAIVSYVWTRNGAEIARGVNPAVTLPLGTHVITLTITTSMNVTRTAQVSITVKRASASLQKSVRASSTESGSGNIAPMAVDGNETTRWSSAYSDPQWLEIDLGIRYNLDTAVLLWEDASARSYRLEVSDNRTDWTVVRTLSNMAAGTRNDSLKNLNTSGRYVRMYGTARTRTWGYSLWELELFGTPAPVSNEEKDRPEQLKLHQNYPNPFNPETVITFELPSAAHTTLSVHDTAGRIIETLVNTTLGAGSHRVAFNAERLSSGTYLYRLTSNSVTLTGKMVLVK
jgi:hypothetical protein